MLTASLAIPTYNRDQVLIDTLESVFALHLNIQDIIVVDQTVSHGPAVEATLARWSTEDRIRLLHQGTPSLTMARNRALRETSSDVLIFIDDDVILDPGFLQGHLTSYDRPGVVAVAGRVKRPEGSPVLPRRRRVNKLMDYRTFDFESTTPYDDIGNFYGCNHSVLVEVARSLGGYDERYTGNAIREETDFALRIVAAGHRIVFAPEASLLHLAAPAGGCRVKDYSTLTGASLLHFAKKHTHTLGWRIAWDFWVAARVSFLNKVIPLPMIPRQLGFFMRALFSRECSQS